MRIIIAFNFGGYIHEYLILFSMSYNNNFFDTCNFLIFTRENEPRWLFSLTIFRKYFIHCRDTFLKFASISPNPQKYCIAWLIRFLIFQNILHIDIVYQIHRIITRKFLGKNLRLSDFRVACAIATSKIRKWMGRGRSRGCLSSAFSRLRGDSLGEA